MPKKVTKKSLEKLLKQEKSPEKSIADTGKFKTNPFAKKYKEELSEPLTHRSVMTVRNWEEDEDDILEAAQEVKSWNRSPISQTVNLTYIFLAFIIGFSLCAVVMTPIIISAV